jgi:hypothetical protein
MKNSLSKRRSGKARLRLLVATAALALSAYSGAVLCDWGWAGGCTTQDCARIWCGPDQLLNTLVFCQTQQNGTICCQCKMEFWSCKGALPCPNPSMVKRFQAQAFGAHCQNNNNVVTCVF